MAEVVLDVNTGQPFVQKASDPAIANVATPGDFAGQFPTPLDTTEILALCEDISVWQALPEKRTMLQQETWREMTALQFTSGSNYLFFTDGACPEEYEHEGSNTTVSLKNIGAKKSLTISDIMHSMAVAAANWNGINNLVGPMTAGEGLSGGAQNGTFYRAAVGDLKEKEVRLGMTLVMNGWDKMLVQGNISTSALQFDGIEPWFSRASCSGSYHSNDWSASGAFSATTFDRWLVESCAKPTHIFGHPQPIQEMLRAYFSLGYQGSQLLEYQDGNRMIPGFNFASFVNTGVGRLQVVSDINFTKTANGSGYTSDLYALRLNHNGEPLVYKETQIPLSLRDLVPGCTAISFEVWAKTALIIKHCCAHGVYKGFFIGTASVTTCTLIG